MPYAEIISIGDELLIGQVINTNAAWIGQQLSDAGITVRQHTVISDNEKQILETLRKAAPSAALIVITGGLGPTRDDITKAALCKYFDTKLVLHEASLENIMHLYQVRGYPMSKLNREQAEIPESCTAFRNLHGTAPGMWFEKAGVIYVSLPGVPFEMKPILTDHVLPRLRERFGGHAIIHKTVLTQGVGESFIAEKIRDWEDRLPAHIKLAYLPQPGIVRLRLSGYGSDKGALHAEMQEQLKRLRTLLSDLVFGYDEDTLEDVTGRMLLKLGKTLVTAESCTGGYLSHRITAVPGSSAYYRGSIIAYSNEVKINILGVNADLIEAHGAVSEQVVSNMALNVRKLLNADFALAVSGIAGPAGGSEQKPVGTTWIALASEKEVVAEVFHLGEDRGRNIHKAALSALNILRKALLKELPPM
ncbi:MAG TPA: competence/damage-inducible protein A [Bacteroidales bacterium]|nr:competence/damage-inducible protein A [Bacteroidales bacterium]HSA43544.1 competence/damage-inducible protein A [Bacteroidales bacterium]